VTQKKTGRVMAIQLHRELAAELARTPKKGLSILSTSRGTIRKDDTVRNWLQEFAAARGYKVVPHGLRKNAVNALLGSGLLDCGDSGHQRTDAPDGRALRETAQSAEARQRGSAEMERLGNGKTKGKPVIVLPLYSPKEGVIPEWEISADRPHTFRENRATVIPRELPW
jgi:hypothetical protein